MVTDLFPLLADFLRLCNWDNFFFFAVQLCHGMDTLNKTDPQTVAGNVEVRLVSWGGGDTEDCKEEGCVGWCAHQFECLLPIPDRM